MRFFRSPSTTSTTSPGCRAGAAASRVPVPTAGGGERGREGERGGGRERGEGEGGGRREGGGREGGREGREGGKGGREGRRGREIELSW